MAMRRGVEGTQAKSGLRIGPLHEPGLHHVAFNVERHEQINALHAIVRRAGAVILDGPGEFPFGPGGYYAFYFRGVSPGISTQGGSRSRRARTLALLG
jgi:catechol 2,3-dioxygenase-like lactoylglutathione lyase family enzyme